VDSVRLLLDQYLRGWSECKTSYA